MIPSIQRDYVWSRSQIPRLPGFLVQGVSRGLVADLGHEPRSSYQASGGAAGDSSPRETKFLLDGQQRLTSLAWVFRPSATPEGSKPPDVPIRPKDRRHFSIPAPSRAGTPTSFEFRTCLSGWSAIRRHSGECRYPITETPTIRIYYDRLNRLHHVRDYLIGVQTYSSDEYEESPRSLRE